MDVASTCMNEEDTIYREYEGKTRRHIIGSTKRFTVVMNLSFPCSNKADVHFFLECRENWYVK